MARPADPNVRSKLLRAAEHVFGCFGVERAHVDAIASEAGVSKGAFYNHFPSKDDAFREVVQALLQKLGALIAFPERSAEGVTPESFFARCLETDMRIFQFIWENRQLMRMVLEGGRSHAFVHLVDEFAEHSRRLVVDHLEYGKRTGLFRADLDVELASNFLSGGYDRLARRVVRMDERPDFAALLSAIQTNVLHGIARSPAPDLSGVSS
jgi:AcrR family transcriptional regulator